MQSTHRVRFEVRALIALIIVVSAEAMSESAQVSANLCLATDFVFRGVSQTLESPALQGGVNVSADSGWYAYVWASSVNFAEGANEDGASYEVDVAVGYAWELSSDSQLDIGVVRYAFPGTRESIDYDFTEFFGTLSLSDAIYATAAYAPDVDGLGSQSRLLEFGGNIQMTDRISVGLRHGYYELNAATAQAYRYSSAAITYDFKRAAVEIAAHRTHDGADAVFGADITDPRVVASLSFFF